MCDRKENNRVFQPRKNITPYNICNFCYSDCMFLRLVNELDFAPLNQYLNNLELFPKEILWNIYFALVKTISSTSRLKFKGWIGFLCRSKERSISFQVLHILYTIKSTAWHSRTRTITRATTCKLWNKMNPMYFFQGLCFFVDSD